MDCRIRKPFYKKYMFMDSTIRKWMEWRVLLS